MNHLYSAIRDIPDFPSAGIVYKDITPLLLNPPLFADVIDRMTAAFAGLDVEKVIAIESRGFIFGSPVARALGAGLALARKPGKLPAETHRVDYDLEYGSDAIETHLDSISPGERVVVIDDVLATGGTAQATARAAEAIGGTVVGLGFLIELAFLNGRDKLEGRNVWSLLSYPRER